MFQMPKIKSLDYHAKILNVKRMLQERKHALKRITFAEIGRACGISPQRVEQIAGETDADEGFERCRECGGMVLMPCRYCEIKAGLKKK
jgi:hypothetical protein